MSEDALDGIRGDRPDSKKAEDVVNAEGVKIIAHLGKALFPPRKTAGRHARPVVGGKTPVLALGGEGIGRGAGLPVHVEKLWRLPGISAVTVNPDGDIAFDDEAGRV